MSAADVAVGMMDGAYFTSRNELLTFFNSLLNLNLTKIEQTASGAVACQLTEYLFPGSIPMSKVNWAAKSSHEYVGNYKLLQKAFTKNKVQRYVDVDKLIRGKYQDNLEFCQWLKAFFDMQNGAGREDYDPVAVRAKGKGGKTVPMNKGSTAAASGSSTRARAPVRASSSMASSSGRSANAPVVGKARIGSSAAPSPRRMTSSSSTSTTTSSARSSRPVRERPVSTQKENTSATNLPTTSRKSTPVATSTTTTATPSSVSNTAQVKKYQDEITTLTSQNTNLQTQLSQLQLLSTELEMNISTVESERDFYFEKLRGIEVMLQVYKEQEERGELVGGGEMKTVIEKIFKVMYAAAEDNVVVDDEGNLVGDITIDDSVVQNNESFESIRPHAQDELVNDEEDYDDEEEEELLTSGIVEPVEAPVAVEQQVNMAPMSDDDDDDDDELLTSGIISPVNEVHLTSDAVENVGISANQHLQSELDDDDDELLTSGIDSGDEAAAEDDATNRSAENARIISQLVGDDADEDLLVDDDTSQDEY
ncbi:hypothetical protein ACHAWT_007267 [Skeletonema menzelii]